MPLNELFSATRSDVEILDELARRAEALGRSRIEPEDFHVEKSELATGMRRLAGRMRAGGRRLASTTWRPPYGDP